MCIRAGIDTYPTRDLARFNEGVCRGAHLHTKLRPRTGESRRIYAISGHGLRRQSAVCALAFPRVVEPGWSRWRRLVREYLLPSVFLSSAASHSLLLSLSLPPSLPSSPSFSLFLFHRVCNAERIENAWRVSARLCRVIGGAVVSSGDLPSFPARIVDIIIYRWGDGSISTDKVDLPVFRYYYYSSVCLYPGYYSRDHGIYICLGIVPFICLIVKADTSLFRARARSLQR